MIPAGYESKKYHNKFDNYDDGSEFDDEEEGFVFDFNQKKNSNKEVNDVEEWDCHDATNSIKYEVNNNYFCDDAEYVLDDLKNAILSQNLNLVKEIIEKNNLDINCTLDSNWIPIMYAVSCGSYELTEYFIEKGADYNFDEDSYNLLMCACGCIDPSASERNLAKIIDLLVSKGADINQCDKYYQTPLMYVCRAGNTTLIDCLIKYDIDLNAKDDNEWTSLSHACSKGNYKCVHKLLRLGADPLICSIDYLYPHDIAEKYGFNDIKDLIQNYLKAKKIETLKQQNKLSEFFENDNENNFSSEDSFAPKKKENDEMEIFLNALKLSNLAKIFKQNNISMKDLLEYKEPDLKNVGIFDEYVRQLIVSEVKKFHHRNWLSSSLIPVKNDSTPSGHEAVAIISNISRNIDFVNQNIKYLMRNGTEENKGIFQDEYLNSCLYNETKNAFWNCNNLMGSLESFYNNVKKEINKVDTEPIDLIKPPERKKWYKDPVKMTALGTIALSGVMIIKTKFFS
ncbi:unnamed protein product [Brachionus calyciflorus]|uniref:SAM domain-containing protein n=1 Tax=Brachionus calyciflorus TaxID=104777 RepID=A0A813QN43_9BILA|nr:unnamed protein product [Brachionus calyciflorus]